MKGLHLHLVGPVPMLSEDPWSRRVADEVSTPLAELTTSQVAHLEELARWLGTCDEARSELRDGLARRDYELCMRAARRLLAVGALMGDIASRMERCL